MWDIGRRLGFGKFAVVHEVRCRALPQRMAAKIIHANRISAWAQGQLKIEAEVWGRLSHPHICKFFGSVELAVGTEKYLVFFLELAAGGELFERIVERENFFENDSARFMRQLLSALSYLHANGVIHRDLKPENLLLDAMDDSASLKIADFGACKLVEGQALRAFASTPCGSLGYAAPEQMRQQMYERQCDLWSAGVIAYVLLSGCMPFDPSTYAGSSFNLVFPEPLFSAITADGIDFIRQLLQIDPMLRPTAQSALGHCWLSNTAPLSAALPTPRQLKILRSSGNLDGMFSHANDIWLYSCATTPVDTIPGLRKHRHVDDLSQPAMLMPEAPDLEVPILALPSHVHKRLKKGSSPLKTSPLSSPARHFEPRTDTDPTPGQ